MYFIYTKFPQIGLILGMMGKVARNCAREVDYWYKSVRLVHSDGCVVKECVLFWEHYSLQINWLSKCNV